MIVSYHVNSSCFVLESSRLNSMMLIKMCLVSVMGMFEYMLDISRDANLCVCNIGVSFEVRISCVVFFILKVNGKGVNWLIDCVSSFDSLCAGVFCQFTVGRMG